MSITAEHPTTRPDYLGRYEREMDVNLTRMYENTLDWEHLPYLHSGSFFKLDIIDSGAHGWLARVGLQPAFLRLQSDIKLEFEKEKSRWIVTNVAGLGTGAQVWTTAVPLAENRIKVVVDFFAAFVPRFLRPLALWYYRSLYRKLYNEDEGMMLERQIQLDARRDQDDTAARLDLGLLKDIRARLPFTFEFQNKKFLLTLSGETLQAHSLTCPHMLGPLEPDKENPDLLYCPWHGYKFDRADSHCVKGNERLKLAAAPRISVNSAGLVQASPA